MAMRKACYTSHSLFASTIVKKYFWNGKGKETMSSCSWNGKKEETLFSRKARNGTILNYGVNDFVDFERTCHETLYQVQKKLDKVKYMAFKDYGYPDGSKPKPPQQHDSESKDYSKTPISDLMNAKCRNGSVGCSLFLWCCAKLMKPCLEILQEASKTLDVMELSLNESGPPIEENNDSESSGDFELFLPLLAYQNDLQIFMKDSYLIIQEQGMEKPMFSCFIQKLLLDNGRLTYDYVDGGVKIVIPRRRYPTKTLSLYHLWLKR